MACLPRDLQPHTVSFQVSQTSSPRKQIFTAHRLEVTRTLRVIKTIDFGWPTTKLPPRREPAGGGVSKEIQAAWLLSAKQVIARCDVFQHGFRDHDLDDFRGLLNLAYEQNPQIHTRYASGEHLYHFSRRLFDCCLYAIYKERKGLRSVYMIYQEFSSCFR